MDAAAGCPGFGPGGFAGGWRRAAWAAWTSQMGQLGQMGHRQDDEGGHRGRRPGPPWGGPPFGWGFPGGGGPRRPRQRKGDVRAAVLALLAEQPMHGYQVITELAERSRGAWRPSPGSVYPTLQQLEDEGLVTVAESGGRRVFTLTDAGRQEVARQESSSAGKAPWEQLRPWEQPDEDEIGAALRQRAGEVMAAVMQVASAGTPEQAERAERLLVETRRALYRLLAEDDTGREDAG